MYDDASPAVPAERTLPSPAEVRAVFPRVETLAGVLDHTLLKPEATREDVLRLAREAAKHGFACAMVHPVWVPVVVEELRGSGVRTGTVLGFPHGATLSAVKQAEAQAVAQLGARDLDTVVHVGGLRTGMFHEVAAEIRALATIAHEANAILKVILETSLLSDEQKRTGARIAAEAGADFVKTSTGFSSGGATVADVELLHEAVRGTQCRVKASGGIRTLHDAVAMSRAGASRLGASASVAILEEWLASGG